MHPVLIKIGPVAVYSYGFMVAVGFGIAAFLIYRHAARLKLEKDRIIDMLVLMLLCGIAGARLLYILLNFNYYLSRPLEVFDLSKGGLVWYGGFLAGLAAGLVYARINKLDLWLVFDLIVPYAALAQAFGRIGCYLNGCCYGIEAPAGYKFAVVFPDSCVARHPTQLYAVLLLLLVYAILRLWQELPHYKGEIFLAYCILYPMQRFAVEFLRGDNPRIFLGMTISQLISLAVFSVVLVIYIYKRAEWKRYLRSK